MAAKQVGRPVRLALTRPQMFGPVGGRPFTEQRIVLAARQDGTLTAMRHDTIATTSTFEDWMEMCGMPSRIMYAVPNHATTHRIVALNVGTPTFMRAPGEASAVRARIGDGRLAWQLGMDPVALRLANYAAVDPQDGKPWSSNKLRECYEVGARRFGWSRRTGAPRTMRDGDTLIGLGMAAATYPANRSEASARRASCRTARPKSRRARRTSAPAPTVMTQVAADALGFSPQNVRFVLGDSSLPRAPVSGGSQSAASVAPAVREAALQARAKLVMLAVAAPDRRCTASRPTT